MVKGRQLIFTIVIGFLFFMTGCGQKLGDTNVFLGGKVTEKEDKIIIEGESNLLPGSRVLSEVYVDDGEELFSDSTEIVDDKGKFHMEMDHPQYGDAEVIVTFDFNKSLQEEEVVEHYGEGGKNIEGPFVYLDEHWDTSNPQEYKKAEARVLIEADDDQSAYNFTEPTWKKQPDDYGDPRVWIELDEITEDGEFFYLKGTTNLLEGSQLKAYYGSAFRDGITRVNPDGTFEFKMEYKYLEDEAFTITFHPSEQWSTIQDHYGSNGDKLVGSLVESSGDTLFVQYVHDYKPE